jgi:tRNA-2-methylthio-N6-dimethylallyladenosine synthase
MNSPKIYIETYGCQMNLSDTEILTTILKSSGYTILDKQLGADVVLLNTCSVREHAENRIYEKLKHLKGTGKKKNGIVVGILGCMAEHLRDKLIDSKSPADLVVGPDEYRSLPLIIENALHGEKGIAVRLSRVETYSDITPTRTDSISAWISIMRGCNNFCSYCVVPYTRGRERSRSSNSIIREFERLKAEGVKEITFLGQNVNSYQCPTTGVDFPDLLEKCSSVSENIRIRFITSHPRDMSDKLIETIAKNKYLCKSIHLPLQSGSNRILEAMNRKYTFEHYLDRINKIRKLIPDSSLTTDLIAGFPSETMEDHEKTLEAMKEIKYDGAFMFKYSPREGTRAFKLDDDIPDETKLERLNEIIALQNKISKEINHKEIGKIHEILVESPSRRNINEWLGRSDTNKIVIFPNQEEKHKAGDIVNIKIERASSATLFGNTI